MKTGKKTALIFILSSLCTVAIFSFLFKTVHPSEILQVFRDIRPEYLALFIGLSLSGSFCRAIRYRITLIPGGFKPEILPLFLITLVRNFTSDLLPARLGSAAYIYLARVHLHIPYAAATSSFALAFLFDLLALAPLLFLIAFFEYRSIGSEGQSVLLVGAIVFGICIILLTALGKLLNITLSLLSSLSLIPTQVLGFLEDLKAQITLAKEARIYYQLFLLSLIIRICKYGSLYVFLVGILVPLGYGVTEVPLLKSLLGILSAETAASLPISGIAGFGAYEGAWTAAFHLMGFPLDLAKLTAISHHLFTQLYGYSLGALALLLLALPYRKILFFLTTPLRIVCTACLVSLIALLYSLHSFSGPPANIQAEDRPASISPAPANPLSQAFIFDSRRSATFGIYLLQNKSIRRVVDSPKWHEMYPDPSPDGSIIVYARARSLSRHAPAEIWTINLSTRKKQLLVANGTFPTFSTDGQKIYFERDRKKVMSYSLKDGQVEEIFPAKNKDFAGHQIVKPRVSFDGQHLSFTADKPAPWHAWRVNLNSKIPQIIAEGCEPAWTPDGDSAWVKKEGLKSGSGIMIFHPETQKSSLLFDEGPPFGHEYFPTISPDGKYLLFSASPPDEHDHLTSNYQIFAYSLDHHALLQITADSYTNRWPKLLPDASPSP